MRSGNRGQKLIPPAPVGERPAGPGGSSPPCIPRREYVGNQHTDPVIVSRASRSTRTQQSHVQVLAVIPLPAARCPLPPSVITMQITFYKLNERQCYALAVRGDGVTVRVPGYGPINPLPHDVAHVVVEQELRMRRGFWGSVAGGAMFAGMTWISGRRPPHATEVGSATVKANGQIVGAAEALVGFFVGRLETNIAPRPHELQALRAALTGAESDEHLLLSGEVTGRIWERLQQTAAAWSAAPAGGSLTFEWRLPAGRLPARPSRRNKRSAARVRAMTARR